MNDTRDSERWTGLGSFFTSLLNHDISNYNQTSRGYLEMLLDEQMGPLAEEQQRAIAICLRQTNRIQELIESIKLVDDLAGAQPKLEPTNLDNVISTAIQSVQNDYKDREIRVRYIHDQHMVTAEPHLPVVFRHILSNAVRHNDADVVEIRFTITPAAEPVPSYKVLCADNGNGIPPARRAELFNRLDERRLRGSGFGLSLVKTLVERCGGRVWLEATTEGVGSVFGVLLPKV